MCIDVNALPSNRKIIMWKLPEEKKSDIPFV